MVRFTRFAGVALGLLFLITSLRAQGDVVLLLKEPYGLGKLLREGDIEALLNECEDLIGKKSKLAQATAHYYQGEAYLLDGQVAVAGISFQKAGEIFNTLKHEIGQAVSYMKLGSVALQNGEANQANIYYTEAYQIARAANLVHVQFEILQNQAISANRQGEHEQGMRYLKEALKIAKDLRDSNRSINIYTQLYSNFYYSGDLDSAIYYFEHLIGVKEMKADSAALYSDWSTIGNLYTKKGDYLSAQNYLIAALRQAELAKDTFFVMSLCTDIAKVYAAQSIWNKAKDYAMQAIDLSQLKNVQLIQAENLKTYGLAHEKNGETDAALQFYNEALNLFRKLNYSVEVANVQLAIGRLYQANHNYEEARAFIQDALKMREGKEDQMGLLDSKLVLSALEIEQGNAKAALPILEECLEVSLEKDIENTTLESYRLLAQAYEQLKDYKRAYQYHTQYAALNESLVSTETGKALDELTLKYETEKKDKDLLQKEAELEAKRNEIQTQNYQLIFLAVVLGIVILLIAFLYFVYSKNRQLNQKQIEVLKKEQEAQRLRAVIEGEEKERRRIAQDLHDGLGAYLATVKMRINALEHENPMIKSSTSYQKAEELIDEACRTVRTISHNMMPNMLEQYGLENAIQELCTSISQSHDIDISFIPFGLETPISNDVMITIYRIVQELLQNIIKHAEASEVIVQLTVEDNELILVVEDNGKGFDKTQIEENNGIGLSNIVSRVKYLDGDLEIDATPGEGSTFTIQLCV